MTKILHVDVLISPGRHGLFLFGRRIESERYIRCENQETNIRILFGGYEFWLRFDEQPERDERRKSFLPKTRLTIVSSDDGSEGLLLARNNNKNAKGWLRCVSWNICSTVLLSILLWCLHFGAAGAFPPHVIYMSFSFTCWFYGVSEHRVRARLAFVMPFSSSHRNLLLFSFCSALANIYTSLFA